MPVIFFDDNLQSYSAGPGIPSGFQTQGIVFVSEFEQPASPTPAPGFYERTGIVYGLFGSIAYPVDANLASTATQNATTVWATLSANGQPGTVELFSTDPTNPTTGAQPVISVIVEPDATVSVSCPGATKVNSQIPIFPYLTWNLFQMTCAFSALPGTPPLLIVGVELYVNGTFMLSASIVTNINVLGLWNGLPTINQWVFTGPPNGQFFGEFYADDTVETLPFYPFPGTPLNSHVSQIITELGMQYSPNARLTQAITELVTQYSPNARCTQMIVELIVAQGAPAGGFPEYVKRHQAAGND